jgi:hypothetical protein
VDVGPLAGPHGGEIVYEGSYTNLLKANTITGKHMQQSVPMKEEFRTPTGKLPIKNAKVNNLQNVSVNIPTGVLTVVTGVAGSGKSSLINEVFQHQHRSIVIDQSAVGSTPLNRHVYGHPGRSPQSVCFGEQGAGFAVQLQLEGRMRKLSGAGCGLHRPVIFRECEIAVRNLRRQTLQG